MPKSEVALGGGTNLNIKSSKMVTLYDSLMVMNQGENVVLDVKIQADFDSIPERYHEIFLNVMSSKYYSKASFGDNPFSQCLPIKPKKWWQFWKTK